MWLEQELELSLEGLASEIHTHITRRLCVRLAVTVRTYIYTYDRSCVLAAPQTQEDDRESEDQRHGRHSAEETNTCRRMRRRGLQNSGWGWICAEITTTTLKVCGTQKSVLSGDSKDVDLGKKNSHVSGTANNLI